MIVYNCLESFLQFFLFLNSYKHFLHFLFYKLFLFWIFVLDSFIQFLIRFIFIDCILFISLQMSICVYFLSSMKHIFLCFRICFSCFNILHAFPTFDLVFNSLDFQSFLRFRYFIASHSGFLSFFFLGLFNTLFLW